MDEVEIVDSVVCDDWFYRGELSGERFRILLVIGENEPFLDLRAQRW